MRVASALGILVTLSLSMAACGGAGGDGTDPDEVESEGALSTAGQILAGAYVDGGGTTGGIRALVLKTDGTFFADVDSGARCIRAPCPASNERVTGTYSASKKTVTLKSSSTSSHAQVVLGRFNYTKSDTAELTLKKGTDALDFVSAVSYCSAATDCEHQKLLLPACSPRAFECSSEQTCATHCGSPLPGGAP